MNNKMSVIEKRSITLLCVVMLSFVSIVGMEMRIQLDDGALCTLTPDQVESSALLLELLEKQALLAKIRPEHIVRWGYDESLYTQVQNAPLYVSYVNNAPLCVNKVSKSEISLFQETLVKGQEDFAIYVSKLAFEQKNMLLNVSK